MAVGSVSTPTGTTTTTTAPSRASKPSPSVPKKTSSNKPSPSNPAPATPTKTSSAKPTGSNPKPARDHDGGIVITGQLPAIKNAAAIAQAVTGEKDIQGRRAGEAVMRAMHGDMRTSSSHTTLEIRREGTHVGSRDARQGVLEAERVDLARAYAQSSGSSSAGHRLREEIDRVDGELRSSRAMNAVADTLHVLGADDYHVGVLEDETRVKVVADDQLSGSAGYDRESHSILVSQSLSDQAANASEALYHQGILDVQGRIVKGREDDLDASFYGDQLIKVGTLIGYHEQKHAEQDFIGGLGGFEDFAKPLLTASMNDYNELTTLASMDGLGVEFDSFATTDDAWNFEKGRIDTEEYDAYLAQEQADLALGASVKVQLVTDENGTPLERSKAVENIMDMERGRSLRNGPDAGWIRDDILKDYMLDAGTDPAEVPWNPTAIAGHGATMIGETPGWKRPGWKRPGWKRPGMLVE